MADNINHSEVADPNIHESKGVAAAGVGEVAFTDGAGSAAHRVIVISDVSDLDLSGADAGDVFTADGAGSGAMLPPVPPVGSVVQGVYNYDDLATATTPIDLTLVDTNYVLTNDAAGAQTLKYPLVGLPEMWDEVTNTFDWTDGAVLALGDTVDIRFDLILTTTTTNTEVTVELVLDVGGLDIQIPLIPSTNFSSSGVYPLTRFTGVFMGSNEVLNGTANVVARANKTGASVEVNGWYLRPFHTVGVGG
jgi:hypothetical protein